MENNHKTWLDNEYSQWVKALQESTVHNFKEHPVVKRMLGVPDINLWAKPEWINESRADWKLLEKIDDIGLQKKATDNSRASLSRLLRMVWYAEQVLKRKPTSICEIGGGVGQFYAILRALGYKGDYFIGDLPDVMIFQDKYLKEVEKQTGLNLKQSEEGYFDFICSFYAVGEFDDEKKSLWFKHFINKTEHGYIAWNPHSGATDDLSLFKHDIKVTPGIEEGIKIITW